MSYGKGFRCNKKTRLIVLRDDLKQAKRPPLWMQELLFTDDAEQDTDANEIAG